MPKRIKRTEIPETIKALLDDAYWLDDLEPQVEYSRSQDDHEGDITNGVLHVVITCDGDAHVMITYQHSGEFIRFRTALGGGLSLRTRNALVILALAMKMDQEEQDKWNNRLTCKGN